MRCGCGARRGGAVPVAHRPQRECRDAALARGPRILEALPRSPSSDAPRIFTGIARSYDRAGALFSFGQDPRWRRALVGAVGAHADDVVLDVATGTGLVAVELARRSGCRGVGRDRSAALLAEAARRN